MLPELAPLSYFTTKKVNYQYNEENRKKPKVQGFCCDKTIQKGKFVIDPQRERTPRTGFMK